MNVSAAIDGKDFEDKISTQRSSLGESHAQPVSADRRYVAFHRRRKVQFNRNELLDFFNFVTIQDKNLLPLFRLKNTPKRAEHAHLSISILKI